jgi:hypothetical protein
VEIPPLDIVARVCGPSRVRVPALLLSDWQQ